MSGSEEGPKPGPSKPRESADQMTLAEYLALPENQAILEFIFVHYSPL